MIRSLAFGGTIVAGDNGARVAILGWHRLGEDGHVVGAELGVHVDAGFVAEGAFVRGLGMLLKAAAVDAVTALHEDDGARGVEHVFAADGTVAVDRAFDAFVAGEHGDGDAGHAFLAVEEVFA